MKKSAGYIGKAFLFSIAGLLSSLSVHAQDSQFSFFITSEGSGQGANLGGLEGADQHCQSLADAAGAGDRQWRAYLSTQTADRQAHVNARDRIGTGPWHNIEGVLIASDVADLHSESVNITKETALNEKGDVVNGRGDTPNQHDILTGSQLDGSAFDDGSNHTCSNWESSGEGTAQVGHHDRTGGGANPSSWNSAHGTRGCSQENLISTGGNGYFYCFAAEQSEQASEQ